MCFKDYNRKNDKSYKDIIMDHLVKVLLGALRRISKLTLYQLLWTIVCFVIFFLIWRWPWYSNDSIVRSVGKPVIVWWKSGFPGTKEAVDCFNGVQCDVFPSENDTDINNVSAFLFYASNIDFNDLPLPRRPKDVIWGLYHEESPRNVEELMHDEVLSLFNFSSTFSRNSNIPFPLQYLESKSDLTDKKYFVPTAEKNKHLKEISPVMYLQTDCETATERDSYVKELMKHISVDSYGECLNNKLMPEEFKKDYLNNLNDDAFLNFIARYKFVIAIENGVCNDYITEKFWRPIKVGTVPVYFGSPSVRDWFPNEKSAILLEDFPTPKLMADYLMKLSNNDTLYEEYLEHKTKEIITNQRLIEELSTREYQLDPLKVVNKFECFVCEKLHSIKEGKDVTGNIVNQSHYNCPKPMSALTLNVNPSNFWVQSWYMAKTRAKEIYNRVMTS